MIISRLKLLIWLPVYILLSGCRQRNMDKSASIPVIDIVNNLGKYQAIPVSEFVSELEYIPLETRNDCLILEISQIIVTSTHIFVKDHRYYYAFNRAGRFIRQISNIGQGPGEYTAMSVYCMSINEIEQSLYLPTFQNLLEFSYAGEFRRSIRLPEQPAGSTLHNTSFVRDGLFIGHVSNNTGNEQYNFLLFNEAGQVVKSFDNHVLINPVRPGRLMTDRGIRPFKIAKNMYVKEELTDTLYCLNEHNELVPQFVFDLGKYALSNKKRAVPWSAIEIVTHVFDGTIRIPAQQVPMVGTPDHIFFSYLAMDLPAFGVSFPEKRQREPPNLPAGWQRVKGSVGRASVGIYDIKNHNTRLLDSDPVSLLDGLINDIDGGLVFWPQYCTSDNELIDIWQAHDMKEILTEEYFAAHEIKNPQAHQRLKELLKNLDEDDNPVVVIAKLKQ